MRPLESSDIQEEGLFGYRPYKRGVCSFVAFPDRVLASFPATFHCSEEPSGKEIGSRECLRNATRAISSPEFEICAPTVWRSWLESPKKARDWAAQTRQTHTANARALTADSCHRCFQRGKLHKKRRNTCMRPAESQRGVSVEELIAFWSRMSQVPGRDEASCCAPSSAKEPLGLLRGAATAKIPTPPSPAATRHESVHILLRLPLNSSTTMSSATRALSETAAVDSGSVTCTQPSAFRSLICHFRNFFPFLSG